CGLRMEIRAEGFGIEITVACHVLNALEETDRGSFANEEVPLRVEPLDLPKDSLELRSTPCLPELHEVPRERTQIDVQQAALVAGVAEILAPGLLEGGARGDEQIHHLVANDHRGRGSRYSPITSISPTRLSLSCSSSSAGIHHSV